VFSAFTEGNKLSLPKTMPPKQQITKQNYYLKKHPKLKLLQSPFTLTRLVFFASIERTQLTWRWLAGQCRNHFDAAKIGLGGFKVDREYHSSGGLFLVWISWQPDT